jgi:hypothetical protein
MRGPPSPPPGAAAPLRGGPAVRRARKLGSCAAPPPGALLRPCRRRLALAEGGPPIARPPPAGGIGGPRGSRRSPAAHPAGRPPPGPLAWTLPWGGPPQRGGAPPLGVAMPRRRGDVCDVAAPPRRGDVGWGGPPPAGGGPPSLRASRGGPHTWRVHGACTRHPQHSRVHAPPRRAERGGASWDDRTRTYATRYQKPLPYQLGYIPNAYQRVPPLGGGRTGTAPARAGTAPTRPPPWGGTHKRTNNTGRGARVGNTCSGQPRCSRGAATTILFY